MTTLPIFSEETPGLLSVGWDLFYHILIIGQMSQNVKDR